MKLCDVDIDRIVSYHGAHDDVSFIHFSSSSESRERSMLFYHDKHKWNWNFCAPRQLSALFHELFRHFIAISLARFEWQRNNLTFSFNINCLVFNLIYFYFVAGVTMREKKGGALQKLKKRLSHSFGRLCKCWKSPLFCHLKIISNVWPHLPLEMCLSFRSSDSRIVEVHTHTHTHFSLSWIKRISFYIQLCACACLTVFDHQINQFWFVARQKDAFLNGLKVRTMWKHLYKWISNSKLLW